MAMRGKVAKRIRKIIRENIRLRSTGERSPSLSKEQFKKAYHEFKKDFKSLNKKSKPK